MTTAIGIYAGSYDPFTYGHLSVVRGACKVFDHVIIAIGVNSRKRGLFTPTHRQELILEYLREAGEKEPEIFKSSQGHEKCSVSIFEGLLIGYAKDKRPCALVRGLRAVSDFESEMAIAHANRTQESSIQTIFIPAEANDAFVSSSTVRELALFEGSKLNTFVNELTATALRTALKPVA